ncbi:flavin-containing monooxygenase [Pseudoduganella sp. UC29_106]|uniref:flavin-containing monooxygenase n=1 Tax=Pseudoduganella sp. UC29_106 TaxID=3374553 RepID=UPI003756BD46
MDKQKTQRELRVVVMGAGMAGILAGIKLREAGFSSVVIYEKAARVGGTWRENTYPGLTCDVPSHAYTYSFEPNPEWSRFLPPGAEVQAYFEHTVAKYGIADLIRFNEEIVGCEYLDGRWHLTMKSGLRDTADIVIAATGVLHHPKLPELKGLASFEGKSFHSSRWDHSVPLDGQRVGVIGNGSTGVQIVSALAGRAAKVSHFQRTAQWIFPVENLHFSDEQKAAFRSDTQLLRDLRNEPTYLSNVERFTNAVLDPESPEIKEIEAIALGHLERSVPDTALRNKLLPDYRIACKRLIYSPDYYKAIQHPDAALVTDGIECVEARGIRTRDGKLHELDLLVLATGFKADQFMRPMNVQGRDGVKLNDVWAKRPRAYLAVAIPQFPNFYMLNGPTGPVGNFSLIDIAEQQWQYVSQLIELVRSGEYREVEATQQALDEYDVARIAAAKKTVFGSGCNSWYLDAEGVPATWPWSQQRFREAMTAPNMDHYTLRA